MKFTKFIPLALALTIAVTPAFADPDPAPTPQGTRSLDNLYVIDVPEYFNVTQTSATTESGHVTIGTDMSSLTMDNILGAQYRVVNNVPNKKFYIKAEAGPNKQASFNGEGTVIAFANTATDQIPEDAAIRSAADGGEKANNANAIAFTFTTNQEKTEGAYAISAPAGADRKLTYTVQPGTYNVGFTMAQTATGTSFSSHDAAGQYKAKITITDSAS